MNNDRLPWFPCEPSKLLGALSAMKPHVGYTYWIVCLRHYEVGGPVMDTLDALARRTGYTKRVVSDALDVLFRAGKLVREGAGIVNPYAADVLSGMRARHDRLSQSGQEGSNRRWKKSKQKQRTTNGHPMPSPMASDAELHLDLEEEKKEERKTPEATASARAQPDDFRSQLFRRGTQALASMTGRSESSCRTLIGSWLKQYGDEAVHVLAAIDDAVPARPADPTAWISGALRHRFGNSKGQTNARPNSIVGTINKLQRGLEARADSEADGDPLFRLPPR